MKKIIYLNNAFIHESQAAISPLDTGYLFGNGLFETIRSYAGCPFLLEEHLSRLRLGLQKLDIPEPQNLQNCSKIIAELITRNHLSQEPGTIKIVVSRGSNPTTDTDKAAPPTLIIMASKLDLAVIKRRQKGMRAQILPWRRDPQNPLLRVKSLNYLENRYGLRQAQKRGFDEGIFLNHDGKLCEGSFSNLFLIRDNTLLTPSLDSGILPGITRNFILKRAEQLHLDCRETPLYPQTIKECDGAFLTSSLMEIAPLIELDKHKFDLSLSSEIRGLLRQSFPLKVITAPETLPGSDGQRRF